MYEFNHYDPAQPQIITSFKGNQKLILGGYRYNIHHEKGDVKTWRCVCAKKLTGARSWCKGRAETWDTDSKGIPKGEHNHTTEHDLAELEYFKSQLIFAAIAEPQADLNVLMDEASKFLSKGLNFGNRESMKKSLIVARKSAETGELKLGQQPHRTTLKGAKRCSVRSAGVKHGHSATVRTLGASNTKSSSTTANVKKHSPSPILAGKALASASAKSQKCLNMASLSSTSSSFLLNNSAGSSGLGSSLGSDLTDSSTNGANTSSNWSQHFDLSGSGLFDDNPAAGETSMANTSTNSQYAASMNLGTSNEQLIAAALFAAAMLGSQQQENGIVKKAVTNNSNAAPSVATGRMTGQTSSSQSTTSAVSAPALAMNSNNAKRKSARVNGILQKLSNKAVAESASVSPSPPLQQNIVTKSETMEIDEKDIAALNANEIGLKMPKMVSVETQTDDLELEENSSGRKRQHDEEQGHAADDGGRKIICCCCCDDEEGFNVSEMPSGCKKRARLMRANQETPSESDHADSNVKIEENLETSEEGMNARAAGMEMEMVDLEQELKLEIADEEEDEEVEEPEEDNENIAGGKE